MEDGGSLCGGVEVGRVVGTSTPLESIVDVRREVVEAGSLVAGSYVVAESLGGCVLGIVEAIRSSTEVFNVMSSSESVEWFARAVGEAMSNYTTRRAKVRWVSYVEPLVNGGRLEAPKLPVEPGGLVRLARPEVLERVFSPEGRRWVRLGRLMGVDVEYRVNVNALTRHLAILAVTGGGKSNTVCVLVRRIVGGLGGTVLVFDMHGEYGTLGLEGRAKLLSPAKLNPASLTFEELLELTRFQGTQQERLLRWLWIELKRLYNMGRLGAPDLIPRMMEVLGEAAKKASNHQALKRIFTEVTGFEPSKDPPPIEKVKERAMGVLSKLEDLDYEYRDILDPHTPTNLASIVEPGKLTVMDLSRLDEKAADAVVSHYLRRILTERRKWKATGGEGYPSPIIVVIEEAHVLIPAGEDTLTKMWAARTAREGRKFGVGLVMVSQRPKRLDPDVLSQANNKIVLRMVEPQDIRYVQAASEELSEDLASLLPSLNTGEAVVMGSMTRLPAVVKIDRCDARHGGGDIDLVEEWGKLGGGEDFSDYF
ncbi:MAG: ATP-binding protein [Desulfurococcales archaeon]|nr:ATP-binding protein [Desulfurococcales archaeon]